MYDIRPELIHILFVDISDTSVFLVFALTRFVRPNNIGLSRLQLDLEIKIDLAAGRPTLSMLCILSAEAFFSKTPAVYFFTFWPRPAE